MNEALKLALVIEEFDKNDESLPLELLKPISAKLRFIAELESQEPVACVQDLEEVRRKHLVYVNGMDWKDPLYTHPPQRTWVGLTDKVITKVVDSMPRGINGWMSDWDLYDYARAIEAKLKEKNT